jgi:hypothetical protein
MAAILRGPRDSSDVTAEVAMRARASCCCSQADQHRREDDAL